MKKSRIISSFKVNMLYHCIGMLISVLLLSIFYAEQYWDKDLLTLGRYKNIRIVTPREFWKRLRKE